MAENEGLHLQLTADASNYISTVNKAKNKLAELAAETKILKQGEKDIQAALTESKKKYGENSAQVDRLTADLADNAREQEKLKQEIKEVNDTLDKATKEYKEYGNSAKQSFESVSQQSQKTAETLKSGFNMVKGLIVGYAGKKLYEVLIGSNADYEQSLTSFEVLLQSADKADVMMQKLEKMGASTPFELSDLTAATEQLLAYGTAESDIETRLQQLGDLSKGNAEKFESMTNAYGRMLAKGKVSLEELNMFTEAGVPILEELQTQYGVTGEEMFKMISDGKVGVEEINSAMKSMTSEGGQFFGMMEKQSQTLEGMLSTMSDNVTRFGRLVGEETFEFLKTELDDLIATINEMSESGELQAIAEDLGHGIATTVTFIIDLVKWLYEMKDVIVFGTTAFLTFKAALAIGPVIKTATTAMGLFNDALSLGITKQVLSNIESGKTVILKNNLTGAITLETAAKAKEMLATDGCTVSQVKLNTAILANPYVWAAALLAGLVSVYFSHNAVIGEATDKVNELKNAYDSVKKSTEDSLASKEAEAQITLNLKDKLLALNEEIQNETTTQERANEARKEFDTIAKQLAEEIPTITDYLYDQTGAIDVQTNAVNELADAYYNLQMSQARVDAYKDLYTEAYRNEITARKEVEKWESAIEVTEADLANHESSGGLAGWFVDLIYGEAALESDLKWKKGNYGTAKKNLEYFEKETKYYEDLYITEDKERLKNELIYNNFNGSSSGNGNTSSSSGYSRSSSSSTRGKTEAELAAEAFKQSYESDLDFIEDRNFYNDWGRFKVKSTDENGNVVETAASEIKAYEDLLKKLRAAYDEGIIDYEYYSQKTRDISKKLYTAEKDAYKERLANSEEYIRQREKLDDWGEDSKIDAIQRMMDYTDEAFKEGVITWDEYCKEIGDLSTDLYTELKNMVEEEKERIKEQLEEELETKKQYIEDELEYRKQQYDKEIEYLDELKAKREDEKEDENYAERMARLQAKLKYEMDDDNRRALQKEIAELQEEIDDTEFDREIERKKSVLENYKTSDEEKAQTQIDKLSAYYEERMSDVNIAETVYRNLDFGKFKEMGELMGENLAAGISGALDPYINAINKLVTLGSNVQSPTNNTVTTTDNSISVNQYNTGVSNVPGIRELAKAVSDEIFLTGRLG